MNKKEQVSVRDSVQFRLDRSLDHVEVSIVSELNEFEKMTPHIKVVYAGLNGDDETLNELGRYFSENVLCTGIEQREDWINASQEVKQKCWDDNVHPAMYKK